MAAEPTAASTPPSAQQTEQKIQQLEQQLDALKAQVQQIKSAPAAAAPAPESPLDNFSLWGYGEAYYTNPVHDGARSQADLARAVFGIGYSFGPHTRFNSEYEVEHAVSSANDPGEFEVEQFYINQDLTNWASMNVGLFLIPSGLLNQHHEPTNFYGVQRNFVETLIIPSTWREGGVSFQGDTDIGLSWNLGVTTGLSFAGWDYAPEFPQYSTALDLENSNVAPMQASHQELALANAQHLSQFLALNYNGIPGFNVGASIFSGEAEKVPAPPASDYPGNQRVTLWEAHTRWQPGRLDLSALYARGTISNTATPNSQNPGTPNPIPSLFYGYYAQAAYTVWQHAGSRIAPFVRWELYDMGARYAGASPTLPAGDVPLSETPGDVGPYPVARDRVWTYGVNYYLTPNVVLKADYQNFSVNRQFTRVDLGLGLNF
ncbi:MAG: porin [Stenotrophobium sp.]